MDSRSPSAALTQTDGVGVTTPDTSHMQWIITGVAVLIVGMLFGLVASTNLHPFALRFNPFAMLSLLALVSNVVAFVLVSRLKARTEGLTWFALHLFSLAIWAAAEVMIRLSATPEAATFWSAARSLGAYFMPVSFYMFALSYTNPRQARRPLIFVPLMAVTLVLLFFDFRTSLFNMYLPGAMVLTPWGYMVMAGPAYIIMISWVLAMCGGSLWLFYRFYRRTLEPDLRRQAWLFMVAIFLPLVGGGITDGLMPMLHVLMLPMAVMLTAAMGFIISYGILKYRVFTFSPELIASNILETMNEAVIGTTPDFRITYANSGAVRLLGYSVGQFTRRRLTDFLSQSWTMNTLRRAIRDSLGRRDFGTFDSVDLRSAQGGTITAKLSITRIVEDNRVQGYLAVITDISKIAQATEIIEHTVEERTHEVEETKGKLVSSINSLELGFVMTDERPEVVMVNNVAHELFCRRINHSAEHCRSITVMEIEERLHGSVELYKELRAVLDSQRPRELKDVTFDSKSWRVYLSPMVAGGRSTGCAILWQDITEEHILERSRDEFFSIASHELRTPLTAIKGNSSMILQYYAQVLKDPALKTMVDDIHESSGRLIGIVNDFLDVSRLEQGRIVYQLAEVSLAKALEGVAYEMTSIVKQKHIYLRLSNDLMHTSALPPIIADEARLKQILFNLLGNAAKFTEQGGITVDATVVRGQVRLTVSDTGVGVDRDHQALLFHKFQQAGSSLLTRDASGGTGLGLYISRLLARGMGGSLELVRSAPNKGSVFALTVPIATPARRKQLAKTQGQFAEK